MWAPSHVVDKHKKRASFVWLLFLGLIASYTIWLFVSTYEKRKNPAVTLQLKAERYPFPTVSLCFVADVVGFGCDSWAVDCTENADTLITYSPGFEFDDGYPNIARENKAYPTQCIDLWLSNITEAELESELFPPQITFQARWQPNATGVDAAIHVSEISESVYMFFTDPAIPDPLGDHNLSSFLGDIPYSRQVADSLATLFKPTTISMEMTESVALNGETTKSYFAASITPNDLIIPDGIFSDVYEFDIGVMIVALVQPELSHTLRREVDPLEWAEIVGNVGGTWEILLIMWGLLFVATREEPNLKGRNLKKTAQRGVEGVVKGAQSVASTIGGHRVSRPATFEDEEAAPAWDTAAREANARSQRARIPAPAFNPGTNGTAPVGLAAASNAHQPQSTFFRSRRFGRVIPNRNGSEAGSDASNVTSSRASARNIVAVDIPRPVNRPPL